MGKYFEKSMTKCKISKSENLDFFSNFWKNLKISNILKKSLNLKISKILKNYQNFKISIFLKNSQNRNPNFFFPKSKFQLFFLFSRKIFCCKISRKNCFEHSLISIMYFCDLSMVLKVKMLKYLQHITLSHID